MGRRERVVFLVLLGLVALALRLGYVLSVDVEHPLRADAGHYVTYARNLVEHATFSLESGPNPRPDSFRSPGYPAFLALLRLGFGPEGFHLAALVTQALLGVLLVPLSYRLARGFLRPIPALAAATLTALAPHLVTSCGYLLTEAMTAPLLAAALCAFASWRRRRTVRRGIATGVLLAALYFVQEAALPLPFLFAALVIRDAKARAACGVWLAIFVSALLAWQVRSALLVPEGAATAGQRAVATLSHGSYPQLFFRTEENRFYPYREDPEQPRFGKSWMAFAEVLGQRVQQDPWTYAKWYLLEKPCWVWSWAIVQGQGDVFVYPVRSSIFDRVPVADALRSAMALLHPICVGAMVLALLRRRMPGALVVTLVWFTLLHSAFLPDPRYLVPLKPLLFTGAAAGVEALWALLGSSSRRAQLTPAS